MKKLVLGIMILFLVGCGAKEDLNEVAYQIQKETFQEEEPFVTLEIEEYNKRDQLLQISKNNEVQVTYKYEGELLIEVVLGEYQITYKYNKKDQLIESRAMDFLGDLKNKSTYTYDEKGNQIKRYTEDAQGKFLAEEKYIYNEDDQLVIHQYVDEKNTWEVEISYDEKGNQVQAVYYSSGNKDAEEKRNYNEEGLLINSIMTTQDEITTKIYDEKERCIKEIVQKDGEEKVTEYQYTELH